MKQQLHLLWTILIIVMGQCPLVGNVHVEIAPIGEALSPGSSHTISVSFQKTTDEKEQRLCLILDLIRDTQTDVVQSWVMDQSGNGYTQDSATVNFSITLPNEQENGWYLRATAAPWSLNRQSVTRYKSYPTDGTYPYAWVSGSYGVTQNLYYLSNLLCPAPGDNTTYCSGVAFETFLLTYQDYFALSGAGDSIGGLSYNEMKALRLVWYGVTDAEKLCARAIPQYGLGVEITNFEEAQEGDFVQLWRHSGSGHNVVFVNWMRSGGQIIGVRYWSTQGSTNGIGTNVEYFGTTSGMDADRFYIARLRKPRDKMDQLWALGTATAAPTQQSSCWILY